MYTPIKIFSNYFNVNYLGNIKNNILDSVKEWRKSHHKGVGKYVDVLEEDEFFRFEDFLNSKFSHIDFLQDTDDKNIFGLIYKKMSHILEEANYKDSEYMERLGVNPHGFCARYLLPAIELTVPDDLLKSSIPQSVMEIGKIEKDKNALIAATALEEKQFLITDKAKLKRTYFSHIKDECNSAMAKNINSLKDKTIKNSLHKSILLKMKDLGLYLKGKFQLHKQYRRLYKKYVALCLGEFNRKHYLSTKDFERKLVFSV